MEHGHTIPFLQEMIIVLLTAGLLVPLFHRLRVNPVLGYLAVGVLVGPYGIGALASGKDSWLEYLTLTNQEQIAPLAEFGVVFLLFMIGLELSPKRLWEMRKLVFGLGTLQVVLSTLGIAAVAYALGHAVAASVVLGLCFALSSTAIVMQILMDRQQLAAPLGRASFSILLFQDLAVVPALILIGLLGMGATEGVGAAVLLALGKAVGVVVVLIGIGRFVLRPVFRIAGSAKGEEPFMAMTLLTVLLISAMTGMAGLSMALGAFLGGLLLAETEYRHAIEVYIEPFKGLLLGLFFMTVGMGIDLLAVEQHLGIIVWYVAGLMVIKTAVIMPLARVFGFSWTTAIEAGLLLGQGGEFAFVIVGAAMASGVLPKETGHLMLIVAGLSMAVTPVMAYAGRHVAAAFARKQARRAGDDVQQVIPEMQGHVIVAGVGRVGRALIRVLEAEGVPYVALDNNMDVVATKRTREKNVFYGDASRHELLKHFSPGKAQAVVLTMSDAHEVADALRTVRRFWPDVPVLSRARDKRVARILYGSGANIVVAETVETSMQLSNNLLKTLGVQDEIIARRLDIERQNIIIGIKGE